jgi:hypothetical protein
MHDNDDPSIRNMSTKNTMDLIKLSIHLFQKGMKGNGLEMCGIKRMDGTSAITRSTLFLKET